MVEVAGNMHIHTRYSDGEQWHDTVAEEAITAGLDFIIVTDHNVWVRGVEGYYERENGRVLLLTGEEVHNVRRQPQASHMLIYGAGKELAALAADPQNLIDETVSAGGYCFLAHPHERDLDLIDSPDLGWHDWDIEGFSGLEIWNYMSSVKNAVADRLDELPLKSKLLAMAVGLPMALRPETAVIGPEQETLALWDSFLARGMRVAAVGNSDAHATPMSLGPIKRVIYPYEFLFRAVNTHLLLPRPLNGDVEHDRALILRAIGRGHSWIGYDMPHPTNGFRFTVQGERRGHMGDEMVLGQGATLQISAPTRCHIRLIRHGEVVAEVEGSGNLTYVPTEPGAYRAECLIAYEGRERGWIYSNPIYLR
jgi:hypothetical protein